MTVTDIQKNIDALTLTVTSRFNVTPARLWRIWADPRQLERWWGPPTYPATVVDHDFREGGTVTYFMTSPEGEKYHGWWNITRIEVEKRLEFVDGFSDDTGIPNPEMPTTTTVTTFTSVGDKTTATMETTETTETTEMKSITQFASVEAMDQLVEMGMIEGLVSALSQVTLLLNA
jgi:uncharacterized protein YndB with AHSA1/START domain